jgi:hypothetical protein
MNDTSILRKNYDKAWRALRDAEAIERDKNNQALIGRCFKFDNTWGDSRRWWLYIKVVGTKEGRLEVFKFQTDCNDEIRIEPLTQKLNDSFIEKPSGYIPISEDEFQEHWRALQKRIGELAP